MVHTRSVRAGNSSQPLGRGQAPSNLPPPHPPPPIPNTLPHVDHAEGGDENQPHNSAHNSASTANQDNNPGDPLINLLNPAPQPPAPQQNPEPIQHATAISESQGQSHFAPIQQPLHDDVTRRLDSLEKLVAEQRGAPHAHHAADSIPHPLNTNITLEPYPAGFRIPQLETYDGTKDPDDHLHAFYSCMQAQNTSDALMCKIFPSTLRGNARTWYYSLPPRSISSYTEMASAFATKFSSRRLIRKTTSELMQVRQRDEDSLKNFMSRFNDAVLEVNSFDQVVGITAVISGLSHERFRDSLLKHPATTFSEVNDRSLKFITVEEYALSQNPTPIKNQCPDWGDENPNRKWMRTTQNRGSMPTFTPRFGRPSSAPPQQPAGKPPVTWTPFNLPRSQIFMQIKNKMDLKRPSPMRTAAATRDHTRYCDFHQDHSHTTEQCNSLRSELESLAQKGMLNEYIQRVEQPQFVREQGSQHQGVRNPPNRQEVKHPNRAQKRKFDDADWKNQPITFTSTDFDTVVIPHNDPLVTSVLINNCEVQRVLVDTGSAPDIMYFHCFESLGLDPALLQRYDGPIYGFNNQPVPVEGALTMNVAFGSGRTYVTPSVQFLSHLCMKFPTPTGIATLRGNQEVARHCYITSVTQPQKGKDQTPEVNPKRIPDDRQVMGVEIVDNRPKDETRAAPVEDVEERLKVIKEEVEKLLQAGFVRRVDYCEWVANPVLVKKANGKWRMCIDYTNHNNACPKDCYPMPNIDKLVEAVSGNERLSLLNAYSGYHQVPMAPEDEEKTSFYAGDEIYCYMMMPFRLKNAGAAYQKMVTIVFRAQIGRNLEVYVDDIVVKSLKAEDHLTDLEETFNNLRKNRMRLNPAKCIFGVESGKFLSFMVSRRGIEINPEKIKAVAEMEPSKSVKDVQRLTGRVAALHRFISKSVDKCLPFFKIMRSAAQKDESGKEKKFTWNSECQAAFDELKSYLSSPPLLTKADDGEILYLYLGISDEAISSVLVREEGKHQKPVYYISSVLHGADVRYSIVEKTALAVVTSAKKLIPYFQSHPIIILYVDGASSNKGSGAGAILLGSDGYRSEHALKFNFDATNNMAEYEALLLGLQLATELKVEAIQIYSDSQLVVNQVNSVCEVVDPVMMKYATLVAKLKSKFQKFHLSKIPRAENEQADSLSKFASNGNQSSRSVFVEILDEPSFLKPRMMEVSTDPSSSSWTNPIISFLRDGTVLADKQEEMRLRKKASRYTLVNDVLYKRSFSLPLLRCLTPYKAEYALREVHEGVCRSHVGARTLAHKVLRQGYYWPNMYKDAIQFVQRCQKCQFFAHLIHQPAEELTTLVAPWPFAQWGLDLLGPFMKRVGGVTHLIVGVDYFTKWVEARALSSLTSKKFTSVYHPESNGMVESVNKCILEGIKPRLEQHKAKWADELNNVLWAYRTTSRTATGETPYHLAFGTEAVIPIEIGVLSFRVTHFDEGRNGQLLRENLDLLDEVREEARLQTLVYKQKIANFYNKQVRPRTFKVGDLVLRKAGLTGFETRFGKLAPNWEGPYTIAEVPHLGAYILRDTEGKRVPRVWNVNNLKKFYP
ncbi:hypothetical protein SLEP1_g51822 [Rubroshorea leprosula]|uniref:RNase H type-1 domain-containing protein n=1 Tax=Rubroshorea leprosula TaxID=152421 RepID=A0AAV5M4H1_9ROSI|nr:hypothetical protein SLEP1_g51822 [Rubroshorea leprosula]